MDTHDYIKVIVHLFWKIMYFLFYRISLRCAEDMGKSSMLAMPVTILGVIVFTLIKSILKNYFNLYWCYIWILVITTYSLDTIQLEVNRKQIVSKTLKHPLHFILQFSIDFEEKGRYKLMNLNFIQGLISPCQQI